MPLNLLVKGKSAKLPPTSMWVLLKTDVDRKREKSGHAFKLQ